MSSWLPESEPAQRRPVDARLVPAALGCWAVGLAAATDRVLLVGALVAVGALLVAGALVLRYRPGGRRVVAALVLVGVVMVCTGTVGLLRQAERLGSPLRAAAVAGQFVTVDATVRSDPRPIGSGQGGGRVLVEVTATTARIGGSTYRLERPLVVLAAASGWTAVLPGQRVRFSGRAAPALDAADDAAVAERGPPRVLSGASPVQRAAGVIRSSLVTVAHVSLDDESAGLLVALVDGDTTGVGAVVTAQFTALGLTHLLAVSGANCAIVSGCVLWAARRGRAPFWLQVTLTAAALVAFVVVARPSPSVVRAAAMGAVTLVAMVSGRERVAVPALAAAVIVLLTVEPRLATSAGFALSVVATAGIVVLAPGWTDRLARRLPRALAAALGVAAAAGVATAPVIVLLQPTVNLASIPANLAAAPAVPVATVLGVGAAVLSPWWPGAAELLCWLGGFAVRWLILVAHVGSQLPEAAVRWPPGALGALLLVATVVGSWVAVRLTRSRPALRAVGAGLVVGVVLVLVPGRVLTRAWPPDGWVLVMCDVGQGDALVLRTGPGAGVVIDTGPQPVAVDRCLRELGVSAVPLLVLSHLHQDHVGGLDGVLGRRPVGAILVSTGGAPEQTVRALYAEAARYAVPVTVPRVDEQRRIGDATITVVGPLRAERGTRSDLNNNSLVLRVDVRGHSILLTGDAEVEEQTEYLGEPGVLDVDVLKVPHHGSAYQRLEFLQDATAAVALVSVGAGNDYGHPSPLTVTELQRLGATVYRTDRSGDVAVVVDSEGRLRIVAHGPAPPVGRRR